MSIERIELNPSSFMGHTGSLPYVETKPRNYDVKTMARQEARKDYHSATSKLESEAQNQWLKVQAEKSADINKINNKGLNAPEPNTGYHKRNTHQNFLHYRNMVGKLIDRTA